MRLLSLVLVLVLLAGCTGSDPSKPATTSRAPAPDAVANGTYGSIAGLVWTDEEMPLADAEAVLVETSRSVRSDAAGRFTFNDVEPGEYRMLVERVGYEAAGRKVTVIAGEVAEATFILKAIKLDEPWIDVRIQARDMLAGTYVAAYPNDVQTWAQPWTLKDDPAAMNDLYFEVDWNPSTALGDGIRFFSGIDTWNSNRPLCNGTGHDPFLCRTTPERLAQDWDCDADDKDSCRAQWMFRPGGSKVSQGLLGLWPDDRVTAHISHFYRQPMPEGYSALP